MYVGREMFEAVELAELYQQGLPPVAGGALDQTHWIVEASRFLTAEVSRFRDES